MKVNFQLSSWIVLVYCVSERWHVLSCGKIRFCCRISMKSGSGFDIYVERFIGFCGLFCPKGHVSTPKADVFGFINVNY